MTTTTETTLPTPDPAVQDAQRDGAWRAGSALGVLTAAYAVFFVFPGELALVGPLRSNGTPLRLLGLLSFFLVVVAFVRVDERRRARPVAWVAAAYLTFVVLAWGTAHLRPLSTGEAAEIDRAVLITVAGTGIALLAALLVHSLHRAHVLVGWLAAGSVLAVGVGGLQFVGVIDKWADIAQLPFMTTVVGPMGVVDRLGFNRVPGTTSSPLEYSVVLAAVVPLVVHLAVHAAGRTSRGLALATVGLVLVGLPLGFSRSGLLTLGVTLVVMALFLRPAQRVAMLAATVLAALVAVVAAPSIIGAFAALVSDTDNDYSIQGRLDDYPRVLRLFEQSPWIGNGPSVDPQALYVLDNQWLGTLVRDGVVGVAGLALLIGGGAFLAARTALSHPAGSPTRTLNGALCAGLVGMGVAAGTLDVLSFQQATFIIFLLLGLVGVGAADGGPAVDGVRADPAVVGRADAATPRPRGGTGRRAR